MYFESNLYASLWNKYRPVILKLMRESEQNPQQYKLSPHEFKAVSQREKGGYSFLLEAAHGKALNNIRGSAVAKDLLYVLQQSETATQMMTQSAYELSMDKQFVLQVKRLDKKEEEV